MTWDPPDTYATFVLSIGGGVLAGFVVVALEWGWRYFHARRRRIEAIRELCEFFGKWESDINTSEGFEHPPSGRTLTKEELQFAMHTSYLWTAPIIMTRWANYISEQQVQEIALLVEGHKNTVITLVPQGRVLSQPIYDRFFRNAKNIKWLKF